MTAWAADKTKAQAVTGNPRGGRDAAPHNGHTSQKVVHVRCDSYDLYIGRGSVWGNPFRIGPDGDRTEVLAKYKEYLLRGEGRYLLQKIGELEGKTLGCFCAESGGLTTHDKAHCHGQLLLQLLEIRRGRGGAA